MHGSTKMSGGGDQMPTYWIKYVNLINPNCSVDNGCPWPVGGGAEGVACMGGEKGEIYPKKAQKTLHCIQFFCKASSPFHKI